MALNSTTRIALALAFFGSLSFILGVIAENKKPPYGTPIKGKDVIICKYPNDPTVALGVFSILAFVIASVVGHVAVFFPYKGKSIAKPVIFQSTSLVVFFIVAEAVTVLALVLMMWATITEGLHLSQNVHRDLSTQCPTAKTGLFGGAAFLALDAALFWLVCQMLTLNARADHFNDDEGEGENTKGEYGQVYSTDLDASGARDKV